jgi:aminoglycoside 3-N-acetyltransferase|tara:strand:+ start:472 stop:1266 length:795 start_codon:yes stop_codon:yes gene_type:complete
MKEKSIFQDNNRKYFTSDIMNAFYDVGITEGDTIFIQSDLGKFGKLSDIKKKTEFTKYFLDACIKTVGKQGTVVLPTFTLSFCKTGFFDYYNSISEVNYLTELARITKGFVRSDDPIFSVTSLGPHTKKLIENLSSYCLGKDSIFDRLHKINAKIVLLGFMEGTTFIHHVEEQLKVPYRYNKVFRGRIKKGSSEFEKAVIYNVRDLDKNPMISLKKLHENAEKAGILQKTNLGMGHVVSMNTKDLFKFTANILKKDPYALLTNI